MCFDSCSWNRTCFICSQQIPLLSHDVICPCQSFSYSLSSCLKITSGKDGKNGFNIILYFRYSISFQTNARISPTSYNLLHSNRKLNLHFIAGSSKCTTKRLSSLLTKILTVIKTGQEKYCSIRTSHTGVNNMFILKNSTNLLPSLGHLGVHKATSIQTLDISTLYTSIPHDLLKSRINNIINNAFKHKNGATRCTHIKVGRNKSYFTSDPLNGDNKYTILQNKRMRRCGVPPHQ